MEKYYHQKILSKISLSEWNKFQQFQETHFLKHLKWKNSLIHYCICGTGNNTILSFAGGWGGPELLYNRILYFENKCKVLIVDVSFFNNSEDLSKAINQILVVKKIEQVILFGQSFSGIIAQIYINNNLKRISSLILVNTPALHKKKTKKWAIFLIHVFPFFLIKSLLISKLKKFGTYYKPIPEEALKRIEFSRALIIQYLKNKMSKKMLINIFTNILTSMNLYHLPEKKLKSWNGKTLIISSEDDVYYSDAKLLSRRFPNAELFLLSPGYKHISPAVHEEEFHRKILSFIEPSI